MSPSLAFTLQLHGELKSVGDCAETQRSDLIVPGVLVLGMPGGQWVLKAPGLGIFKLLDCKCGQYPLSAAVGHCLPGALLGV